jgi:hypothetical protein
VHGDPMKVPVPLLVKETVLVGAVAPVAEVSVTVAVQLVATLTFTEDGKHDTLVVVGSKGAAKVTVTALWLGWLLTMRPPSESLAEPVAPKLSTTLNVAVNGPGAP